MTPTRPAVIFFHHGALGDFVLTLPLIRGLAAQYGPTLVVAGASKANLAARLVPGVLPADGESAKWSALFGDDPAPPRPGEALSSVRLVVSMVSDGRDRWASNIRRLVPSSQVVCVVPRPDERYWKRHVTDWHRAQLTAHGVDVPDVPISPISNPAGPIVIHPGSGGVSKCWPAERFVRLIGQLQSDGCEVATIAGEAERERWTCGSPGDADRFEAVQWIDSLDDLARAQRSARLFIGNDAGPTHLAAQQGLPTLALFGPTTADTWRPIGPTVRVLAPPSPTAMQWLSVADAHREARIMLGL